MKINKGGSSALGAGEIESTATQSGVEGEVSFILDTTEVVSTGLFLTSLVGFFELSTNTGEYIMAQVVGTTVTAMHVSANASVTDVALKVCAYRSGNYLDIKNNTAGTVIITFRYRIAYQG